MKGKQTCGFDIITLVSLLKQTKERKKYFFCSKNKCLLYKLTSKYDFVNIVNGVKHNVRVAAFGSRDPGSNPGEDRYIIKFKLII